MDLLQAELERASPLAHASSSSQVHPEFCPGKQIASTSFATLYISFQDIPSISSQNRCYYKRLDWGGEGRSNLSRCKRS